MLVSKLVLGIVLFALTLVACGSETGGGDEELVVSAAASLTDAFTEIGADFEDEHHGVRVTFNFGPSDGLAAQINEGAPIDVFASASGTWMDLVEEDGPGVTGRTDFTRNEFAIVVPSDNPARIGGIEDLAAEGVKLVLAAEGVPAGDHAREILVNAGIHDEALDNVVSNEEDVRAVMTKVISGDADAGIVYVTDVTPEVAEELALIAIPDDDNVIATYPVAIVGDRNVEDLAGRFVRYVLEEGQETLAEHGFLPL